MRTEARSVTPQSGRPQTVVYPDDGGIPGSRDPLADTYMVPCAAAVHHAVDYRASWPVTRAQSGQDSNRHAFDIIARGWDQAAKRPFI